MKKILSIIITIALLTACDGRRQDAGGGSPEPKPVRRFVHVLAISAFLDEAAKQAALAQLELEAGTLANEAAPGSVVYVLDATECRPIATLKAVAGAPRQRIKAMSRPLAAARAFLNAPRTGAELDGRLRLPYLAQTISQLHLPAGSSVVVLGNPLFIGTGGDAFYSMTDGRVPTDGFLFKPRAHSIYSIVGREQALARQYWHMGFPTEGVFLDDSHRERVSRFWSCYLRGQGATLVTFQNGIASAAKNARDGVRAAFNSDTADANAEAAMLKVVKVIHDQTKTEQTNTAKDEDRKPEPPKPEVSKLDTHGNLIGSEHDLVQDGALRGQCVLLVTFAPSEIDSSPLPKALEAKGCEVVRLQAPLPKLAEWKAKLAGATQLWLFSSREDDKLPASHLNAVVERWKTGRLALYVAGDNEPWIVEANAVLNKIAPGAKLAGNDPGGEELRAAAAGESGFRAESPLFHGIDRLFEGSTVSSLRSGTFNPVCMDSDGGILIATLDTVKCGRAVADGGFTRYFARFWDEAGAARLAVNIAGWLARADAKSVRVTKLDNK